MILIFEVGDDAMNAAKAAALDEVKRLNLKNDVSPYVVGRILEAARAALTGTPVTVDDIIDLDGEELDLLEDSTDQTLAKE